MTITQFIQDIVDRVDNGAHLTVDYKTRTLRLDGRHVLKGALPDTLTPSPVCRQQALRDIEELYALYKNSVPSEASRKLRHPHFKALDETELDEDDFLYAPRREAARARLETTLLLHILDGSITWDTDSMGSWFWKSPADRDLVILREWIEPNPS